MLCDPQEEIKMLCPVVQAGYNHSLPVRTATLSPKDQKGKSSHLNPKFPHSCTSILSMHDREKTQVTFPPSVSTQMLQ